MDDSILVVMILSILQMILTAFLLHLLIKELSRRPVTNDKVKLLIYLAILCVIVIEILGLKEMMYYLTA